MYIIEHCYIRVCVYFFHDRCWYHHYPIKHSLVQVPKVWGNVIVLAQGAGQAVVQMDVSYGIDYEAFAEVPTIQTFGLNITEYYSTYRNKSALIIQSCFRWEFNTIQPTTSQLQYISSKPFTWNVQRSRG